MSLDPVEFGKQVGVLIREAVAPVQALVAAQAEEIKALREELASFEQLDVAEVVTQVLGREELKTLVDLQTAESVTCYFTDNPVKNGEDATPVDVKAVASALAGTEEIKSLLGAVVSKHFEANPIRVPQDGKSPDPVSEAQIGSQVEQYLKANPPKPGQDGLGLAGAMIDRDGELIVTKTNGEAIKLGKVVGGKGQDGADFSDVEFDYDGERGLIIRGKHGEITKRLPIPIDRGYWRDGLKAEKGDVYTEDGSAWIALKSTDKKPSIGNSDDWRMMARKGRDGHKGDKGAPYVPPQPVKLNG